MTAFLRHRRLTTALLVLIPIGLAVWASLWVRLTSPPYLAVGNALDDQLFVRMAASLAHGQWLSTFDSITLAKGPSFSLFLALEYKLHIPFLLGLQLFQLVAAGFAFWAITRISRSLYLWAAIFALLALNPAHFGQDASRALPTAWYASVCLILFSVTLIMVTYPREQIARSFWHKGLFALLAVLLGITQGAYWRLARNAPGSSRVCCSWR